MYRGPYAENAPDLLVGYGAGYRASWDSVMGKVTSKIFEDNLKAWSGDHCIDPRLVPGVLFSSHKFVEEKHAIVDVAPTILKLFGLALPSYFDGKPWTLAPAKTFAGSSALRLRRRSGARRKPSYAGQHAAPAERPHDGGNRRVILQHTEARKDRMPVVLDEIGIAGRN